MSAANNLTIYMWQVGGWGIIELVREDREVVTCKWWDFRTGQSDQSIGQSDQSAGQSDQSIGQSHQSAGQYHQSTGQMMCFRVAHNHL